jgi:hypothetical protein
LFLHSLHSVLLSHLAWHDKARDNFANARQFLAIEGAHCFVAEVGTCEGNESVERLFWSAVAAAVDDARRADAVSVDACGRRNLHTTGLMIQILANEYETTLPKSGTSWPTGAHGFVTEVGVRERHEGVEGLYGRRLPPRFTMLAERMLFWSTPLATAICKW